MDKRSTFSNANVSEEAKERINDEVKKSQTMVKKNFEYLHVHVARPSEIHKWQEISLSSNLPERRSHCCSCIYKGRLYIYGGVDIKEGQRNTMFSINLEGSTQTWSKMELNGTVPGKFSNAAEVLVENNWYIVGGTIDNEQSNKIFVINLDTLTGSLLKPAETKLEPMDSHTATLVGNDKIVIFGGYEGSRKSNKIYQYSIPENTVQEIKPKGPVPKPRVDHSAVLAESSLIIFGGTDPEGEKLADLWKFDIEQQVWTEIAVAEGLWPRPRAGHVAVVYNDAMYIFGGNLDLMQEVNEMISWNFKEGKWDLIHPAEKMTSEEERGSPITALKMKKINEEAKKRARGESLSPREKAMKFRQERARDGSSASPKFSSSSDSPNMTMRKTFMRSQKRGNNADQKRIEEEEEASSPIVALMRNSIVMKATSSDKKRGDHDLYRSEGPKMMVGKFPCGRDGHAAKIYADKLYVFGGDRCQMAYNDLFAFPLT